MSHSAFPPPEDRPGPTPHDQMDLLRFLSEESQKNRDSLWEQTEANRTALNHQAEADRRLLTHTLWIVGGILSFFLAASAWLGYKDLTAIEHSAQATLQAISEQNKAAAALERQKGQEELNEIRSESKAAGEAETKRVDAELRARFSEPNLQRTMDNAAKTAVNGKAGELIEQRVQGMISPLEAQARASVNAIHVQELIVEADGMMPAPSTRYFQLSIAGSLMSKS